jgi:ribosome-binding protein aMBF1 (putative translation factor)
MKTNSEEFKRLRHIARANIDSYHELIRDLVAIREARGISQSELAFRMGITEDAVRRIESGDLEPSATLRRMAFGLDTIIKYKVEGAEET